MSMQEPSGELLLEDDHESLGLLIEELRAALAGIDAERAFRLLDEVWARLAVHIRAEHLRLFPAILEAPRELFDGRDQRPTHEEAEASVARLQEDHDFFMRALATAVNRLREARAKSNDVETDVKSALSEARQTVESVVERLAEHNRLEEEQVYGWASRLIDTDGRKSLAEGVRRELTNLPPRLSNT